jgi:hypothetical protein
VWWIVPLALVSYVLTLSGYVAVRRGGPKWVAAHGLGGSYIALVTALLVASAGDISTTVETFAWILPTAVGVPLIMRPTPATASRRLDVGLVSGGVTMSTGADR